MTGDDITAFIGVGSNIDPENNITSALAELMNCVDVDGVSTFYWTKPLHGRKQDDYLNGVFRIATAIEPILLKTVILKDIENKLGRIRNNDAYASRTIDLDLILYGGFVLESPVLRLPAPDIYSRPFIAIPLAELASGLVLPDSGKTIDFIANAMKTDSLIPDMLLTGQLRRMLK